MTAFLRMVCPVDLTDDPHRVLRYAGVTAKWYGARLTVLHAYPSAQPVHIIPAIAAGGATAPGVPSVEHRALREMAAQFVRDTVPDGVDVELQLPDGLDAAREIAYEASAQSADLIVMGTHGRHGLDRWLRDSVAERVLDVAPCPVIVIPPLATAPVAPGDVAFHRILCAVDLSEGSLDAVAEALSLAEDADAHLVLLHVAPAGDTQPESHVRHLRQLVPASAGTYCRIDTVAVAGLPAQAIVAAAQTSDLIVMGAGTRSAFDRWFFGTTTRGVLHAASCPVLVVGGR